MSTDTPRPERVTLTDEEREHIENRLRWHFNVVAAEGKGSIYASLGIDNAVLDVERILAAREQALREEIAGEIEDARDDMCRVTRTDPRHPLARVYDEAANIARGESPMSLIPTRIITNVEEAALAREQGFAVPDHAEDAYPFTVTGQRSAFADLIREAKAEAWDDGFGDGSRQDAEGDDGPRFSNPYREQKEREK